MVFAPLGNKKDDLMNQDRKIDGRGVGSSMAFANQWVGGADAGWTVRRRIMAILRASCRGLGAIWGRV